jgi:hypothetical protein
VNPKGTKQASQIEIEAALRRHEDPTAIGPGYYDPKHPERAQRNMSFDLAPPRFNYLKDE